MRPALRRCAAPHRFDPQPDPGNAGVGIERHAPGASQERAPTKERGPFYVASERKLMEASVAIQVLPQRVGGNDEVCRIVDEAIAYIQTKFPDAYVGPFETTIEGEYDLCMEVVAGVNRICVEAGAPEVATYVKIFFAPEEGVLTTEQKISKYHENDA
jgi:uncharacterized protein YqgV (UPF0045/DUF77 family)